MKNGVEISQDELRETQGRDFRKLMPQKTLLAEMVGVLDNRDNETISGINGNNDMKGTARDSNRRYLSEGPSPKDEDTPRKPISQNSCPA